MRTSRGIVIAPILGFALFAGSSIAAADDPSLFTLQSSASPSDKTADMYGVGGGKTDIGTQQFDLSAHQRPNGEDFGHYSVKVTNSVTGALVVSYRVDVNCVNIHALDGLDRGTIKGVFTKVEPVPNLFGFTEGDPSLLFLKDGGNQSGPVPVDDFATAHVDFLQEYSCKFISYSGNANNVTQGNVNIKRG